MPTLNWFILVLKAVDSFSDYVVSCYYLPPKIDEIQVICVCIVLSKQGVCLTYLGSERDIYRQRKSYSNKRLR